MNKLNLSLLIIVFLSSGYSSANVAECSSRNTADREDGRGSQAEARKLAGKDTPEPRASGSQRGGTKQIHTK